MDYDVIIVGGGASGILTALSLLNQVDGSIALIEAEEELGGALNEIIETIPSFSSGTTGVEIAADLADALSHRQCDIFVKTRVISVDKDKRLQTISPERGLETFHGKSIVFATGSREQPRGILNFTSKRTSGIFSVGTARRSIVKEGYLPGKQVVIYGSDWTGLYLARILVMEGVSGVTIVDSVREIKFPDDELEAFFQAYEIKFKLGYVLKDIHGKDRITGVTLMKNNSKGMEEIVYQPCDTVLLSVGLVPQRSLYKKFRRNPQEHGVFVTGNAREVSHDFKFLSSLSVQTAREVLDYLAKAKQEEGQDS